MTEKAKGKKKKHVKELHYRQSRMQENNVFSPLEVVDSFFSNFTLQEARAYLWDFYHSCVCYYCREGTQHENAAQAIFFYTETEMLIEAAWLIRNEKSNPKR